MRHKLIGYLFKMAAGGTSVNQPIRIETDFFFSCFLIMIFFTVNPIIFGEVLAAKKPVSLIEE
jgi:hypothetical protein